MRLSGTAGREKVAQSRRRRRKPLDAGLFQPEIREMILFFDGPADAA